MTVEIPVFLYQKLILKWTECGDLDSRVRKTCCDCDKRVSNFVPCVEYIALLNQLISLKRVFEQEVNSADFRKYKEDSEIVCKLRHELTSKSKDIEQVLSILNSEVPKENTLPQLLRIFREKNDALEFKILKLDDQNKKLVNENRSLKERLEELQHNLNEFRAKENNSTTYRLQEIESKLQEENEHLKIQLDSYQSDYEELEKSSLADRKKYSMEVQQLHILLDRKNKKIHDCEEKIVLYEKQTLKTKHTDFSPTGS